MTPNNFERLSEDVGENVQHPVSNPGGAHAYYFSKHIIFWGQSNCNDAWYEKEVANCGAGFLACASTRRHGRRGNARKHRTVLVAPQMKPPCLDAGLRGTETLAALAGLTLNVILGSLICFRSNQTLRAYSRVLACNCIVDLAFSVIGYAVEMHADLRAGFLVVVNNGLFVSNTTLDFILLCVYLYIVYLTIAIVALPVVYRYCLICRECTFPTSTFICLLLVVLIVPTSVPLAAALIWYPSMVRTMRQYDGNFYERAMCSDRGLMMLYPIEDALTLGIALPVLIAILLVATMYFIVIVCVLSVWKASKRFNNDTRRIRKLQTQLNYALLLQALVPFFVIVVPFTTLVGTILTGTEKLRRFTVLSTTFLSFIPLINPICTIMIIRPYRDALFKVLSTALAGFVPQLGSHFSKSAIGASDGKISAISGASLTVSHLLPSNHARK